MVRNMLTSLQKMDEVHHWENRPFSGVIPAPSRCKPDESRKTIRKKAKRIRTAYTTDQIRALEHLFTQNKYITPERRREISKALKIGDKCVKIWFQNRRMKEKRESSESSSDLSSENFTDSEATSPNIPVMLPDSTQSSGMDDLTSPDLNQYQVPYFYNYNVSEQQDQNNYASDCTVMQSNYMQYHNECNMYTTEYYPGLNGHYTNDNNSYYCQQENGMRNMYLYNDNYNYWQSNNESSYYFFN